MQYEKQLYAPMTVPFMIFFAKDSNTFNADWLLFTFFFLCFTLCSASSGKLKKNSVLLVNTGVRVYIQLQESMDFLFIWLQPPRREQVPQLGSVQTKKHFTIPKENIPFGFAVTLKKLHSSVRLPKGVFFGPLSKKVTDLFILIYSLKIVIVASSQFLNGQC